MTHDAGSERIQRELAYYKRNLDHVAGENLRLDSTARALRYQLHQKSQGLALLSRIYQTIGADTPPSAIFGIAVAAINDSLGMDRAVWLIPTDRENWFRPEQWAGFRGDASTQLTGVVVELPAAVAKGNAVLLANGSSEATAISDGLSTVLEAATFACVPVTGDDGPIGVLFCGRVQANAIIRPDLNEGDCDILEAIAGLIASAVLKGRVAALQEADRLKAAFFANVSHEFRTPITLSLGPLEHVLSGHYGPLPEPVSENLRLVHRNQERLLGLINQILELARLESGEVRLRVTPVPDLNRLVEEWVHPFTAAAEAKGLELRLVFDPLLEGADLYVDREHIDRLLANLLSNALKFTDRGGITVTTELAGDDVRLTVADTGTGIAQSDLPYVFDRFRRAATSEGHRPGTGIGLALVREVVARHGGEVTVTSRVGAGTSFDVRLPLGTARLDAGAVLELSEDVPEALPLSPAALGERARDAPDVEEGNRSAEAAFDSAKPTILCVEDNSDMRAHVRTLLAGDANVFMAGDGGDGLQKMRRYRPDVVIADQMMPVMSGAELLAAVRQDPELSSTPVLLLTAVASTDARIESLDAGADDYLTKPFHQGELRARVHNLVRARSQARAVAELNRRLEARVDEQVAELVRTGELKRFLPPPVVEALLSGDLEGSGAFERRKVTVLRAGAEGFADLAEHLEPEELSAVLNEYLGEMASRAAIHGGTVESFVGDGLMVIFGAPEPAADGDHAWSGVRAALAMRDAVEDVAAGSRRRGVAAELRARIGLNTGYCTVGIFGSDFRRAYSAVGPPVNVAGRLHDEADGGTILCGFSTYALVQDRVSARRREVPAAAKARGCNEAYEILGSVGGSLPRDGTRGGGDASGRLLPSSPHGARLFRKEGDYWTVAYEGPVFRLRDAKGLGYIAYLLARPRREVHVVDLVTALGGVAGPDQSHANMSQAQLADAGLGGGGFGDAGATLDARAKAAYKKRLEELGEDLEEAQQFNDYERAARAEAEIDALVQALASAVGLGGRDRKAASTSERARLNVTRAIKGAIEKIGQNNATLGEHLAVSIKTGTFCSYAPDPGVPTTWVL